MRRAVASLSLALAAILAIATVFPAAGAARVGGRPPSFTLPSCPGGPSNGRFRLADHLGRKPIVILFWATWCAPCRQELPVYQRLYEQHRAAGLVVVAITMDNSSTIAQAGPAARRLGVRYPVVSDLDTRITAQMNPRRAAPFSVWVDRRGRIVRENEGFTMAERDEVSRGIAALVGRR